MELIDFKEINNGYIFQDFATLFLKYRYGVIIDEYPAIGPDGGRDLICSEPTNLSSNGFRWLVSCKHYAHSGRAVGDRDDEARPSKLTQFGCHGFLFFYSTPHTTGLFNSVDAVAKKMMIPHRFIGPAEIIQDLIKNPKLYPIIRQFFPNSFKMLMGSLERGVICCHGGYAEIQYAVYALYTRNLSNGMIDVKLICAGCINYYIDQLNDDGVDFGVEKIRDEYNWGNL